VENICWQYVKRNSVPRKICGLVGLNKFKKEFKILDAHGHYWKTIIGLPSTTTCWYATDIEKMHAHWHETESGMPDFAGETMDKETRRLCNALRACSHHGAIGFVSKYAAGGAVDPVAESKWQADKLRELLILEFGD